MTTTATNTLTNTLKRIAATIMALVLAITLAPTATVPEAHAATGLAAGKAVATQATAKTTLVSKNVTASTLTYTGKALKPKVTVKVGSKTLKQGRDYTLTIKTSKNKKVSGNKPKAKGTYKAIVKGKGKYKGSVTKSFKVTAAKAITAKMVTVKNLPRTLGWENPAAKLAEHKRYNYNYDDKNGWAPQDIAPYVTVRDGSKKLVLDKDYTLRTAMPEKYKWTQFRDKKTGKQLPGRIPTTNKHTTWEPGKYVVYVMGKGAYRGTICKYIVSKAKTKKVNGVTYTQQSYYENVATGPLVSIYNPVTKTRVTVRRDVREVLKTRWVKYDPAKEAKERAEAIAEENRDTAMHVIQLDALPWIAVSK